MGPQRPTKRSWSGPAQRGNAILCCSVSSAWPRCEPSKATTPPPTACTRRRSHAASTRRCRPTVMVGQAAVARRLGDLARARALLDAAGTYYRNVGLPAGQTGVLAGLAWWALSAGQADDAMVFAADACQAAAASGDPAVQLLADTAVAAVRALADPTRPNAEAFIALAQQRAQNLPYGSLTSFTDEPDVAALAARLALPGRSAAAAAGRFDTFLRPGRHLYEPEVAASDFSRRLTSVSPQRRLRPARQTGTSCSQHKVSPSASMITWTPPGPPLRTTAARSPQACGPRRGTGRHSEPSTAAEPPQRCATPSKPTRRSSSPSPTSTPLPEPQANVTAAGR